MKTELRISMSRTRSNQGKDYWRLTIEDGKSSVQIIDAKLSDENFSEFLSACMFRVPDCEVNTENFDKIGKKHVVEKFSVGCKGADDWGDTVARAIDWAKHQGWIVSGYEISKFNYHNYNSKNHTYSFGGHKWVDDEV